MLRVCLRMAASAGTGGARIPSRCNFAASAACGQSARRLFVQPPLSTLPAPHDLLPAQMASRFHNGDLTQRFVRTTCRCEPEAYETGIIRGAAVKYNDSAALQLRRRALLKWEPGCPGNVLIIKKPRNPAASAKLREIGNWLMARGIQVFVERVVWATEFKEFKVFDPRSRDQEIDFCITLGGDGTVLYMASLFEEDEPLPPVLCFAMGSLGFLTPFDAAAYVPTLERVLDTSRSPLSCTLRTRKRCEVVHDGQLEAVHHVLNECVLDRGAFPGAVLVEIFVDGAYVTNVEADGLIISTPSGSTAYSMSAGGPVVAPSVPCTVLTPIAPLSLSFRPVVLPESSPICVHLPTCARSHARASFDGKKPMRIRRGTSLFFTASLCPLPIISLGRMDTDWYEGITSKLKWNQAIRQLPSCPSPVVARQQELRNEGSSSAEGGSEDGSRRGGPGSWAAAGADVCSVAELTDDAFAAVIEEAMAVAQAEAEVEAAEADAETAEAEVQTGPEDEGPGAEAKKVEPVAFEDAVGELVGVSGGASVSSLVGGLTPSSSSGSLCTEASLSMYSSGVGHAMSTREGHRGNSSQYLGSVGSGLGWVEEGEGGGSGLRGSAASLGDMTTVSGGAMPSVPRTTWLSEAGSGSVSGFAATTEVGTPRRPLETHPAGPIPSSASLFSVTVDRSPAAALRPRLAHTPPQSKEHLA